MARNTPPEGLDGPLAIVGYMGSGKSTVGRIVARRLGWRFVDLDREISAHAGESIPEIFARHGEPFFRALERDLLRSTLRSSTRLVVACGGGAVTTPENLAVLGEAATVFLEEDPRVLYRRTRSESRPLRGATPEDFLERYERRLPLYERAAQRVIRCDGRPPARIAGEVIEWLEGRRP